jgi:hypothetical protein
LSNITLALKNFGGKYMSNIRYEEICISSAEGIRDSSFWSNIFLALKNFGGKYRSSIRAEEILIALR